VADTFLRHKSVPIQAQQAAVLLGDIAIANLALTLRTQEGWVGENDGTESARADQPSLPGNPLPRSGFDWPTVLAEDPRYLSEPAGACAPLRGGR
jgi:hypothetical protein